MPLLHQEAEVADHNLTYETPEVMATLPLSCNHLRLASTIYGKLAMGDGLDSFETYHGRCSDHKS